MAALLKSNCPNLELISRGKVRDLYAIDNETMLFVATDRVSAFDVIMQNGIPGKGRILTTISNFWFSKLQHLVPTHFITSDIDLMPKVVHQYKDQLHGRCMLVKRLNVIPVEAIVRGYITGSAWKEYSSTGTVCGTQMEVGLVACQKLPTPLFTPSTKADVGEHDENISFDELVKTVGLKLAQSIRDASLQIYTHAADLCAQKGILIADTKFEFATDASGVLHLVDEVLTPDSSRFWLASQYCVGNPVQESLDKQFLRNYLLSIPGFVDNPSSVTVPPTVVEQTFERYTKALGMLTGNSCC